jgi:hypothetical protein
MRLACRSFQAAIRRSTSSSTWASADARELVERHLPAECRERDTWHHVSKQLVEATRGGDINDAVVSLCLVLQLERVECRLR